MASGYRCTCGSRRGWKVVMYHCNYSAFNGYRYTSSDYSLVKCVNCGNHWRTKAAYVEDLPQAGSRSGMGEYDD